MKILKTLFACALFGALCLAIHPAFAQTPVPNGTLTLTWINPTLNTDGTSIPATGDGSLTKVQIWVDTVAVPAVPTKTPMEFPPATTVNIPLVVTAGSTLFSRMAVCNASRCGDVSGLVTKVVPAIPKPSAPTSVTISIRVEAALPPSP